MNILITIKSQRESTYKVIDFKLPDNLNTLSCEHLSEVMCWQFPKIDETFRKSIHPTISSIWVELWVKIFFLVRSRNLGLVANGFTGNNYCSRSNKLNLSLPFQMHLSKKLKRFSQLFIAFLKITFIFEHFENDEVS